MQLHPVAYAPAMFQLIGCSDCYLMFYNYFKNIYIFSCLYKNKLYLYTIQITTKKIEIMTTFENIQLNNEVVFENNNRRYTGLVVEVKKNTFTITCFMCYVNQNGHKSFYNQYFNFMKKSGKKANYRNTYGNAISYSKSFEQQIKS